MKIESSIQNALAKTTLRNPFEAPPRVRKNPVSLHISMTGHQIGNEPIPEIVGDQRTTLDGMLIVANDNDLLLIRKTRSANGDT